MKEFIFYGTVFLSIYLCYVTFVFLRKNKLDKFRDSMYIKYLEKVYQIDIERIKIKRIAHMVALTNAMIITVTLLIISHVNHFLIKLLLTFVVLIPFQLLFYHIIGKWCQKKYMKGVK